MNKRIFEIEGLGLELEERKYPAVPFVVKDDCECYLIFSNNDEEYSVIDLSDGRMLCGSYEDLKELLENEFSSSYKIVETCLSIGKEYKTK